MPGVINHYEVLGVDPSCGLAEIRRAYHDEARRWHPDGFAGASPADLAQAEEAMRAVNEAWRVLGDSKRRASFDRLRTTTHGPSRVGSEGVTVDSGVIRIDPRLLDPDFLTARRRRQEAEIANSQAVALRVVPWLALGGLLIGIFVFTAFARSSEAPPSDTVPGPALGVDAGACVRIATGPSLVAVPCDGGSLYDGRVIGARLEDGICPTGTVREVPLSPNRIACLGA